MWKHTGIHIIRIYQKIVVGPMPIGPEVFFVARAWKDVSWNDVCRMMRDRSLWLGFKEA